MTQRVVKRRSFYVGGQYAGTGAARRMHGQMYVESLMPDAAAHSYPLVLIHGAGQTGANWLTTPDGRDGWADWFPDRGWHTIIVDQPTRGRSVLQPDFNGAAKGMSPTRVETSFTAMKSDGAWPQAALHTQWPGTGYAGDPAFDQFYASQFPSVSRDETEVMMREAGAALLDRIGPAILVVHSQSGGFGWLIADARPDLVKGIVALEPAGPPKEEAGFRVAGGIPEWGGAPLSADKATFQDPSERFWGLTRTPLTYDPPVTPQSPLHFVKQEVADGPGLVRCWCQAEQPRVLTNLVNIPVLVVTGEASYHAPYDHCTVRYLRQAGVKTDFIRLEDRGIRGNGHMMMMELNNLEIAALVEDWILANVREAHQGTREEASGGHANAGSQR